jgi:hypothetical protein
LNYDAAAGSLPTSPSCRMMARKRPDWSRPLAPPLAIPGVATLAKRLVDDGGVRRMAAKIAELPDSLLGGAEGVSGARNCLAGARRRNEARSSYAITPGDEEMACWCRA